MKKLKLDPEAIKCAFVDYSSTKKGYKCFHPPIKKLYISADVTFTEKKTPYIKKSYLQGQPSFTKDNDFLFEGTLSSPFETIQTAPSSTEQPVPFIQTKSIPTEPFRQSESEPNSLSVVEPFKQSESEPNSLLVVEDKTVLDPMRNTKVYSRRKAPIPTPRQA